MRVLFIYNQNNGNNIFHTGMTSSSIQLWDKRGEAFIKYYRAIIIMSVILNVFEKN